MDSARLVELRYFFRLADDQATWGLGISPEPADSQGDYARAWLRHATGGHQAG
jgi:hypothetical protein